MQLLKLIIIVFISLGLLSSPWLQSVSATLASDEHLELIKDINVGVGDSNTSRYRSFNGSMYFAADDGTHGIELWVSDGTTDGTRIIKDINPSGDGDPSQFTVLGSYLYFIATDGSTGYELWRTDGTESGTTIVKDINSGAGTGAVVFSFSSTLEMPKIGTEIFFPATNGTQGTELWKSDGTESGTVLVKDINSGASSGLSNLFSLNPFTVYNSELYFPATDGAVGAELWKTDGTTGGTTLVKDVRTGASGSMDTFHTFLITTTNGVFFVGNDGTHGYELWHSDGSSSGTSLLLDVYSGSTSGISSFAPSLWTDDDLCYFKANDGSHGLELWKSDGTTLGTALTKDINSGSGNSNPDRLSDLYNGYTYFQADDGSHGKELWRTDGTTSGTTLVGDFLPGANGSYPSVLGIIDNEMLINMSDFYYQDPDTFEETGNYELWRSDGTEAGTSLISEINPSDSALPSVSIGILNSYMFIGATDGTHGIELWSYWVDSPTPTPTATPGVTSTPTPTPTMSAECTTEKPKVPELFQVDRSGSSATIHFVPLSDSMSSYQLSYGTEESADGNSVNIDISRSDGAIAHIIESLDATKKQYFKVRAKKGCAEGEWSGVKSSINSNGESNSTISTLKKSTGTQQFNKISKKSAVVKKKINAAKQITKSLKKKSSLLTKPKSCFLFWCW